MIENSLNEYFKDTDKEQKDFVWQEYTLEELNLPSADKILQGVKNIEKQVGLVGWREKNYESETYKGFGLTYNPDLTLNRLLLISKVLLSLAFVNHDGGNSFILDPK